MPLAHFIQALLDSRENEETGLHGYAIREIVNLVAFSFPMSNPRLYPTLHRLEEQGFVSSRSEISDGRERRRYVITAAGRADLDRWLGDPDALPVGKGAWRDPMMFRIGLLDHGGIPRAGKWIRAGIEHWEEQMKAFAGFNVYEEEKFLRSSIDFVLDEAQRRIAFYRQILAEVESVDPDPEAEDPQSSA